MSIDILNKKELKASQIEDVGGGEELLSVKNVKNDSSWRDNGMDYNWGEVFCFAGKDSGENTGGATPDPAVPSDKIDCSSFGVDDVLFIMGMDEGENDTSNWLIYGKLKDNRWFYIEAGCDYTGWDCQAGGNSCIAKTRWEMEQFGISEEDLKRMRGNDYKRFPKTGLKIVHDEGNRFDLIDFED